MAYEHLTPRESMHIQRALSQALYYAQRGFHDSMRINAPTVPPETRSLLTGLVGTFLTTYIIEELAPVVHGGQMRASIIDPSQTGEIAPWLTK